MDISKNILKLTRKYKNQIIKFARELISIPGESGKEEKVVERIKKEMYKVKFDNITIDGIGNIIGRIGSGKKIIAIDAHIDTVGVTDKTKWKYPPYNGEFKDGIIYGRGACDQKAVISSMVYAVKIIKELKLLNDYTLYITGTVLEEDSEGISWKHIIEKDKIIPDCVILTEPTGLHINIGHKGRTELSIESYGKSVHASNPGKGKNPVYNISKIVSAIEKLNFNLKKDSFLGKGTAAVTFIDCNTCSMNTVPDKCSIIIDRRFVPGETEESIISEIKNNIKKLRLKNMKINVTEYKRKSYTGLNIKSKSFFPAWVLSEKHSVSKTAVKTFKSLFGKKTVLGKWDFSTNGTVINGVYGIPSFGFGPGYEKYAHSVMEQAPAEHLLKAAAFYALFPYNYSNNPEFAE